VNAVVKGDANSKVTITFKVGGDLPTKVKSFSFKNVDSTCAEGGEVNGSVRNLDLSPMLSFLGGAAVTETLGFRVRGTVDPKARKIKDGEIEFFILENGDRIVESCGAVDYKVPPKNS